MNFFWPTHLNPRIGPVGAFGRTAHYFSFLPALYLAWLATQAEWFDFWFIRAAVIMLAIACPLAGRAFRFLTAGE